MADQPSLEAKWQDLRREMVDKQLRRRGVGDERVLEAMLAIPRERFVPPRCRSSAYDDNAMPIEHGQTISQPFMVAYMTEQLAVTRSSRVLEIGTGTGYQTAILALLCARVYTVERIGPLQLAAAERLGALSLTNIAFFHGDGSLGWPAHAPYDRIMVTAGTPEVPGPLVDQLADGGVLIAPVGGEHQQTIVRVRREEGRTVETSLLGCRFVKLIGQAGWQ